MKAEDQAGPSYESDTWWDQCHSCGDNFIDPPETYFLICGECLHCWKTADDLIRHDYAIQDENHSHVLDFVAESPPPKRRTVDQIFMCPCCGHDL